MQAAKICVVVLLGCALCESAIAAPVQVVPVVASFDCQKAQSNYEKLVCKYHILGASDRQMANAYREALILTPEKNEKKKLVEDQRQWLASIYGQLQKQINDNKSEEDLKNLLHKAILERGVALVFSVKKEPGKIVILDNSSKSKATCSNLLKEQNITWEGINDAELDSFSLSPPSGFTIPDWDHIGIATHAEFDFMNVGQPADVYYVSLTGTHVSFEYYIVAAQTEKEAIEEKLTNTNGFNESGALAQEFTATPQKTWVNNTPKFTSKLFDPSTSPIYGSGWYTNSQAVQHNQTTYLITTSVNNLGGPTFVVFKPKATGLDAICYYRAIPSIKTKDNKIIPHAGYNVRDHQNDE